MLLLFFLKYQSGKNGLKTLPKMILANISLNTINHSDDVHYSSSAVTTREKRQREGDGKQLDPSLGDKRPIDKCLHVFIN